MIIIDDVIAAAEDNLIVIGVCGERDSIVTLARDDCIIVTARQRNEIATGAGVDKGIVAAGVD